MFPPLVAPSTLRSSVKGRAALHQARPTITPAGFLIFCVCSTGDAGDSSASVEAEDKEAVEEEEEEEKQEEGEEEEAEEEEESREEAAEKEEKEEEEEQEEEGCEGQELVREGEEEEEDSGILSDKERQNEEVNEKDNCSASSISSASSTLEREERGSSENGRTRISSITQSLLNFRYRYQKISTNTNICSRGMNTLWQIFIVMPCWVLSVTNDHF